MGKTKDSRKFGGKIYYFYRRYSRKYDAEFVAREMRDLGNRARVVKTKQGHDVYIRRINRLKKKEGLTPYSEQTKLYFFDFGTISGISGIKAPSPRVAVAVALQAYPAGRGMVAKPKYSKLSKTWSVSFGHKRR